MAELSVIIVSFNTRHVLRRCLQSLFEAAGNLDIEVIVVDNASSDFTLDMLSTQFPQVRVIANRDNRGFAAANNQGMALARAETLLLLNSDAFVNADALTHALQLLRIEPLVGIAGLPLLNEDGTFQAGSGSFPSLWDDICRSIGLDRISLFGGAQRLGGPVDWVQGACMFVRRKALAEVGGLDPHFFMYSEEIDWCWRFQRAGWEVWQIPEVSVVHLGSASSRSNELGRRTALYSSRLSLRRRMGGPASTAVLWSAMVAGMFGRVVLRSVAGLLLKRDVGQHSAQADFDLLRAILRMDPLARQSVM